MDGKGHILTSVTVNEDVRGYLAGVQPIPVSHGRTQRYMRRGWRMRLYKDALAALLSAWRSLQPVGQGLAALQIRQGRRRSSFLLVPKP